MMIFLFHTYYALLLEHRDSLIVNMGPECFMEKTVVVGILVLGPQEHGSGFPCFPFLLCCMKSL